MTIFSTERRQSDAPVVLDMDAGRRAFMKSVGLTAAGAAMFGAAAGLPEVASAQAINDFDIANFALNLEYLEAEFYLRAAFGQGLRREDTTGAGNRGGVVGGRQVNFATAAIRQYAEEIAFDEKAHVLFLRAAITALGGAPVARPRLDIGPAFEAAAQAAGLGAGFDAYANEINFLLAAFIFEDVGVTAYKGAARLISNKDVLEAAAGILAVEAYHAGVVRTTLFALGVIDPTVNISNLRDAVDGNSDLDQPIIGVGPNIPRRLEGQANIVPTDKNGIAFSRSTGQVLSIVYLGNNAQGGFFPNALNGRIR